MIGRARAPQTVEDATLHEFGNPDDPLLHVIDPPPLECQIFLLPTDDVRDQLNDPIPFNRQRTSGSRMHISVFLLARHHWLAGAVPQGKLKRQ